MGDYERLVTTGQPPSWACAWGEDRTGAFAAFEIDGVVQRMRWMRPGTFLMGSPADEPERRDNETQHRVTLTRGFWIADTACTQALWQAVMGDNPSRFKGEDRPVENVRWDDVQGFLERAGERGHELRLPTEAEWEYACRAGTTTPFSFGRDIGTEEGNYDGNHPYAGGEKGAHGQETVAVGSLPANPWGLYEMHGNVWEWCSDWLGAYPSSPVEDPQGLREGSDRVLRGGSWFRVARSCRSASRVGFPPSIRLVLAGFRLVRGQGHGQPAEPRDEPGTKPRDEAETPGSSARAARPRAVTPATA